MNPRKAFAITNPIWRLCASRGLIAVWRTDKGPDSVYFCVSCEASNPAKGNEYSSAVTTKSFYAAVRRGTVTHRILVDCMEEISNVGYVYSIASGFENTVKAMAMSRMLTEPMITKWVSDGRLLLLRLHGEDVSENTYCGQA